MNPCTFCWRLSSICCCSASWCRRAFARRASACSTVSKALSLRNCTFIRRCGLPADRCAIGLRSKAPYCIVTRSILACNIRSLQPTVRLEDAKLSSRAVRRPRILFPVKAYRVQVTEFFYKGRCSCLRLFLDLSRSQYKPCSGASNLYLPSKLKSRCQASYAHSKEWSR